LGTLATSFTAAEAAPAGAVTAPAVTAPGKRLRENDPMAALAVEAVADLEAAIAAPAGTTVSLADYQALRAQIATELANRLAIDPARMITAWQNADLTHQLALMAAFTQLGVPYRRNTSKPGEGFDCSGLTTYAWGVAGITLTRQSGAQIRGAAARTADTAMAGDLVYYPGHVMLWLGVDNAIVHAPYTGRNVEVDIVAKYVERFVVGGRPSEGRVTEEFLARHGFA
jgi:cell wall-associated NlpC family hydrolase